MVLRLLQIAIRENPTGRETACGFATNENATVKGNTACHTQRTRELQKAAGRSFRTGCSNHNSGSLEARSRMIRKHTRQDTGSRSVSCQTKPKPSQPKAVNPHSFIA